MTNLNKYLRFLINTVFHPIMIILIIIGFFIYHVYLDNHEHKISIQEREKTRTQAISDARALSSNSHLDYLECYAFTPREKGECLGLLADKYIVSSLKENKYYVDQFGYEAEKLGFAAFLQKRGLSCEEIEKAPEFISLIKLYKTVCNNDHIYLMQFDQTNKKWFLLIRDKD